MFRNLCLTHGLFFMFKNRFNIYFITICQKYLEAFVSTKYTVKTEIRFYAKIFVLQIHFLSFLHTIYRVIFIEKIYCL